MKYQIIYADPPWSYNDKQESTLFMGASERYDTMDLEDIKKFPVANFADDNCVLFMWATSPLLPEAFEVITAWGFKYVTVAFCWVKETPLLGVTVSNLGRWTMGGMEICLLARKGKPQRIRKDIKQVLHDMRTAHSKKPDEIKNRIVKLMGDIPRIELFARQKTEGWHVWGNEVESDIKL